jgi:hypothetical protein
MTTAHPIESNPFALMMNPEAVLAAVAGSDRLARLKSRICRPLDKPTIAHADGDGVAFDDGPDAAPVGEATTD